ncbi:MAG: Hpt domain-containing protein [Acidimicrobiia bacterium]|nr:Hpt domain-containing protein [Acidimicrobiia bacterium]
MSVDNELSVLSLETAMQFVGDPDLFAEIAEMLLDELPEQMGFLQTHWDNGDLENLYKTAHRLKGNFGVVAAQQAHAAAKTLESAARAGDAAASQTAVGELQAAVDEVVPVIKQHVAEMTAQ